MIHFLLCDDDAAALRRLENLIQARYGADGAAVAAFTAPLDALAYIERGGACDAAILDIVMPGLSGTELAARLRQSGFGGAVILLSVSREFGPESYEVDALDYILKPVDVARLDRVLDKLETGLRGTDNASIVVMAGRETRRLWLRDILYAEAGNHVVHFNLDGSEALKVRGNFSHYAPLLLRDPRFARCHGSFVVNMEKIHGLEPDSLTLANGLRIPIAQRYAAMRKQFMQWLMRKA